MGVLACSLAALLVAGAASDQRMEMVVQDDALMLHRPAADVRATARRLAALGADRVRLTASWSTLAPQRHARRQPAAPFDPEDSETYPQAGWEALDVAVRAARDAGLQVQMDLGFWAPRWAVTRPTRSRFPERRRHRPDPARFAAFATAAARRYSGSHPDRTDRRRALPAVRLWATWNEPNHPSFLQPQWRTVRRPGRPVRLRPASPHVYRAMHEHAYDAVKRVSRDNAVLIGNTAATGSHRPGRGGVPPLRFVRELACVNTALRPLRVRECRGFRALRADGFAHHPYSRATAPDVPAAHPDDAPLADTGRLAALLQALVARGRIAEPLGLYLNEYGYETDPPDPFRGIPLDRHADYLSQAAYLARREPSVRMFAQFLLRDIDARESGRRAGTRGYWRDWQTGLEHADGTPKPALHAFRLPFWADVRDGATVLYGQVRPGDGRRVVRIERRDPATGVWVPVATDGPTSCGETDFLTQPDGEFVRTLPSLEPAAYRFRWGHPIEGPSEASLPATPAAPSAP